jgi:tetratricopeptide (TPR) repeat protein
MVAMDVLVGNEHVRREEQPSIVEDEDVTMDDAYKSNSTASINTNIASSSLSATEWKEQGNILFQQKKLSESLEAYGHALKALEQEESSSSSISTSTSTLYISLFSNRALVLYKMRQFQLAEQESSKALMIDPDNVKGTRY